MNRKWLQNPRIVSVLAVTGFLAVGVQLYRSLPRRVSQSPAPPATATAAAAPASPVPAAGEEFSTAVASIGWGEALPRNPFQPAPAPVPVAESTTPEQPRAEIPRPKLSAISIQQNTRLAILNGRIVAEGDTIQAWKVRSIHPDQVILDGPGGSAGISFHPEAK